VLFGSKLLQILKLNTPVCIINQKGGVMTDKLHFANVKSPDDFKRMLKHLRKLQKVTIEDLSQFSGLHRNGVAKIEKEGSDPLLSNVLKLLELLGASLYIGHPNVNLAEPNDSAQKSKT
jgi:predicted transcriptional regulator